MSAQSRVRRSSAHGGRRAHRPLAEPDYSFGGGGFGAGLADPLAPSSCSMRPCSPGRSRAPGGGGGAAPPVAVSFGGATPSVAAAGGGGGVTAAPAPADPAEPVCSPVRTGDSMSLGAGTGGVSAGFAGSSGWTVRFGRSLRLLKSSPLPMLETLGPHSWLRRFMSLNLSVSRIW